MKKIIVFIHCMLFLSIMLQAQISDSRTYSISKKIDTSKIQSMQIKPLNPARDITEKLPDLKFTALNVTGSAYNDNGVTKHRLNVTCTVKNDGNAAVLTDDVTIQGYITTEAGVTQDLKFTGYFKAAGGLGLSNVLGKSETLAPGASKQLSLNPSDFQLQMNPKPVYLLAINPFGGVKESNTTNNKASMTILFN